METIDTIFMVSETTAFILKVGFFTVGSLYLVRRIGGALRGLFAYTK